MGNGSRLCHFMYRSRSRLSATKFQLALKVKTITFPKVITCSHSIVDLVRVLFEARTIIL